jgi:hypothetical protein
MAAIAGALLQAFLGAGLVTKLIVIGSLIVSATVVYGGWYLHVYNKGYRAAIVAIAKQDKRAVKAATDARATLRDCTSRGLVWDQSTGQCGGR